MTIAFRENEGMTIRDVFEPVGEFLEMTPELFEKYFSFRIPNLNEDCTDIIETASQELIYQEKALFYENKIIEIFTYLMNRALSSSMGKYGSYEYLRIQKEEYDEKYKVAKGLEENVPVANAIIKEMERDFPEAFLDAVLTSYGHSDLSGTQIEKMHILIIIRYEYAKSRLNNYQGKAIDFRTKSRTLVELKQWSKLDQAITLAENLPNQLEDSDIENYYEQFNSL